MPTDKSIQEAKEQAADYFGFTACTRIRVGDEIFEIPNPGLLDDDQQERWDELQFELEQCDKEIIEVSERKIKNDDGTETVVPAQTVEGDYLKPYRKTVDGVTKLLSPSYNARLAIVVFGPEKYQRFKAAGGSGSQVAIEWAKMNQEFEERKKSDPKSGGSVSSLEVVRESD